MIRALLEHAAHLAFVLIGLVVFFFTARRGGTPAIAPRAASAAPERPVRRIVAIRGLVALGPLLAALGSGAALYGLALVGTRAPGGIAWSHAGVSMLALVLVGYKLRGLRPGAIRRAWSTGGLAHLASVILAAVSVPLLLSGIVLLLAPSNGSFAAYAHLVAGAWWTGLLLWHLRRYIGPALRGAQAPTGTATGGVVPSSLASSRSTTSTGSGR